MKEEEKKQAQLLNYNGGKDKARQVCNSSNHAWLTVHFTGKAFNTGQGNTVHVNREIFVLSYFSYSSQAIKIEHTKYFRS